MSADSAPPRDADAPSLADELQHMCIFAYDDDDDGKEVWEGVVEQQQIANFVNDNRDAILNALRRAEQPDDARVARALAIAAFVDQKKPKMATNVHHSLSNVNESLMTAYCSACETQVDLRRIDSGYTSNNKKLRCVNAHRAATMRWYNNNKRKKPAEGELCGDNRDAILAALRRAEQPDDARVARALAIAAVVDDQSDDISNALGDAIFAADGRLEGWAARKAIVALAEQRLKESRNG